MFQDRSRIDLQVFFNMYPDFQDPDITSQYILQKLLSALTIVMSILLMIFEVHAIINLNNDFWKIFIRFSEDDIKRRKVREDYNKTLR